MSVDNSTIPLAMEPSNVPESNSAQSTNDIRSWPNTQGVSLTGWLESEKLTSSSSILPTRNELQLKFKSQVAYLIMQQVYSTERVLEVTKSTIHQQEHSRLAIGLTASVRHTVLNSSRIRTERWESTTTHEFRWMSWLNKYEELVTFIPTRSARREIHVWASLERSWRSLNQLM